jgi:hypothetical protein
VLWLTGQYSDGALFETRSWHRLSWFMFFVMCSSVRHVHVFTWNAFAPVGWIFGIQFVMDTYRILRGNGYSWVRDAEGSHKTVYLSIYLSTSLDYILDQFSPVHISLSFPNVLLSSHFQNECRVCLLMHSTCLSHIIQLCYNTVSTTVSVSAYVSSLCSTN